MCGIFGCYLNRPLTKADLAIGKKAMELLKHRGPDANGMWYDKEKGVLLAHTRLKIIDLDSGNSQPMCQDSLALSYNGEIYNYLELKEKLIGKGYNFRTKGDTEVLLTSWRAWGEESVNHFDGMFAFILWDGSFLHAVTDPFGEKPLFCLESKEGVYFASEAKTLIDLFNLKIEVDGDKIKAFIALGFLPGPDTFFSGLYVVPPASHFKFTCHGITTRKKYWQVPPANTQRGKILLINNNELDEISDILVESLRVRLRSDVPLGIFLSSGVDSSLVAALAAKELKKDISSLTVAFPDGVDESKAAQKIANHLGISNMVIDSRNNDSWKDAPAVIDDLYGFPNDNYTAMSVYQMSAIAKKHMTVALTGLGGDELFYGYNKYSFAYKWRNLYAVPGIFWQVLSLLAFFQKSRAEQIKNYLCGNDIYRFLSLKNNGVGDLAADFTKSVEYFAGSIFLQDKAFYLMARDFDINYTLPYSYIPAIDLGSMRAGLEVRTPFLSKKLAEKIASLDQRSFLQYGQKNVLRRILLRYLPEELLLRNKHGFVFPVQRYLTSINHDIMITLPDIVEYYLPIWQKRGEKAYHNLAFRLAIVEHFYK